MIICGKPLVFNEKTDTNMKMIVNTDTSTVEVASSTTLLYFGHMQWILSTSYSAEICHNNQMNRKAKKQMLWNTRLVFYWLANDRNTWKCCEQPWLSMCGVSSGRYTSRRRSVATARIKSRKISSKSKKKLECGPMPNVMAVLPNTDDALCSTPQSLADAHY